MKCPHCQSKKTVKNGKARLKDQRQRQNYLCRGCGKRFNEWTKTAMARLRTPLEIVSAALSVRSEGLGIRATGRSFEKAHTTIMGWEERFAAQASEWSPPVQEKAEVTVEGVKSIPVWGRTFPPSESEGWTIHFIERGSRYWIEANAGEKNQNLFEEGVKATWEWLKNCQSIRWFTEVKRRYGKELWKLASVYLKSEECHRDFPHRKVWREGLEVAMKIKGSQGNPRIEWVKIEHPFTAISPESDVNANHNEVQQRGWVS